MSFDRRNQPAVHGLDIETDTRTGGLDPRTSRIVAVAVASAEGTRVFDDADEALLLDRLDWHLASLEPGVLATWNGANFDLPFLATRFARHGLPTGLRIRLDPSIRLRSGPLPGHPGAYRGAWHVHAHLDAYRVFRADVVPALGVSGGLKSIAQVCGVPAVRLDAAHLHLYANEQVTAYVSSDAACTRELVLRRWASARLAVDRLPGTGLIGVDAGRQALASEVLG